MEESKETAIDDLFHNYRVFLPAAHFPRMLTEFEVFPYLKNSEELALIFKPESRVISVEHGTPEDSSTAHFKVVQGMMIQGKTIPAVADAKVTIDRENKTSLKDRQPHVVMTDANGHFKYDPVDIDTYQVEVAKDDYIFT